MVRPVSEVDAPVDSFDLTGGMAVPADDAQVGLYQGSAARVIRGSASWPATFDDTDGTVVFYTET